MDLVAMLPWWAGVTLGVISYMLLHGVASQAVVSTAQPGQVSAMVAQTLWKTLASIGQYVLPALCLAGAGMSAWRRKERKNLVIDVMQSEASDALDGMSWREFEMLVGEGFRLQGYQVSETGGGGADGGVDLVLRKAGETSGEKFLVQCKQWRALKVGVDVVRELYGVMAARGATGGFVVTSGRFTEAAVSFCERPQRDADRWGEASRGPSRCQGRGQSFNSTACGSPSCDAQPRAESGVKLPGLHQADGQADREAWRECRR
jgi:restriction system protein